MRALLAAALLVLAAPAGAASLYVSPSGLDANDCSQASPCREIRRALQRVQEGAGRTISVADGEYLGFTVSGISGSAADPLMIRAEGTGARILPTADRAWWENRDNILLMQAHHCVIDGLRTFDAPRAGLRVDNSHNVTIRNGVFGDNGTWGIFTNHSNDTVIENNETYGSGIEHGIYVSNSGDRPVLRGNRSHRNRAAGIHMNADLSAGGADGVPADGIISGALVEDNVIYGNGAGGGAGINMDGVQDSVVRNNVLYDNHATGIALFRQNGAQGPKGNLVANNTIDMASDARYALLVGQSAGANVARNNVLYNRNSSRGALDFKSEADVANTDSDYNVFGDIAPYVTPDDWSTRLTLAQWQARGKDLRSFIASAGQLFSDAGARDYRLASGAPAIDLGQTLAQVPRDITGTARPQGTGYDLGAYEFAGGGAANQPPSVAAGPDSRTITVRNVAELKAAIADLRSNDTILLADGTYDLTGMLAINGAFRGVTVRGLSGNRDAVILRGGSSLAGATVNFGFWTGNGVEGLTIADMTIRNFKDHAIITNAGTQAPVFRNLKILDIRDQSIKVNPDGKGGGTDNGILERSFIGYSSGWAPDYYIAGLDVHTGRNWLVRHSTFSGFRLPAGSREPTTHPVILIWNGSENSRVLHNTFINNDRSISLGLVAQSKAGGVDHRGGRVEGNMIYRDAFTKRGDVEIYVSGPDTEVYHNTVFDEAGVYPNVVEYRFATTVNVRIMNNLANRAISARNGAQAALAGNLTNAQRAWFVNPGAADLRLTALATAAIDKGVALPDSLPDFDGQARPIGAAPDVGADEFGSGGSPPPPPPPPPPSCSLEFSEQPQRRIAGEGRTATFSVKTRPAAASYRWQKNGTDIPGATGESYTTSAAVPSDDGARFRVVAVDACGGSHTSEEAVLRVIADLVARISPEEWRIIVFDVGNGTVTLRIPPRAFDAALDIRLRRPEGLKTMGASPLAQLKATGVGVEIDTQGRQPLRAIEMAFSRMQGVDGEQTLVLARYQPGSGWVPLPSRSEDGEVTGYTDHFSMFQVMAAVPAASVESVRVFPNPLRPFAGHSRMNFVNLPANARIRIYSLIGERIQEISADGAGMAAWDGTNAYGRAVASGVYFALAESGADRKTFKVVVQR